jgi:hypothetical protein
MSPAQKILGSAALILLPGGAAIGWFAHRAFSTIESQSQKPCREEVTAVDAHYGAVSCSHAEQTGELKDGYLICKCKKK